MPTRIFTSYYASKNLDKNKHLLVKVSNSAPNGFQVDTTFKEAIPDWNTTVKPYKDGTIDEMTYTSRYRKQLDAKLFNIILSLDTLIKQAKEKDIVLLCYEKPDSFCHRHILAKWLEEKMEIIQATLKTEINPEIKELGQTQLQLF